MSIYRELDPMPEHKTQSAFKGKREHIVMVNMPNMAYPNQHIYIEIPHALRDHVIVPDTIKITLNLDIESTGKTRSIVNNVGRALVKKKVLMLGSKEIYTNNNADIYDIYKYLEKEREEKLLQGIQSANGLKARTDAKKKKKTDGAVLLVKDLPYLWILTFLNILYVLMDLKKI